MKRINLLTDPRIAALYAGVPAAQLGEYTAFLQAFPYRNAMIDGVDWAWIANQRDADDMLVLSGALCAPEVSWTTISALAGGHRVIAPEYPPVNSMDALADGIAAILRREGVARAHVVGGSYGGFVAQVFARRHPAMTRSLVLSHTRPPWPDDSQRIRRMTRWLSVLPGGVLRWLLGRQLSGLMPEKTPQTAVLHATFQEMLRYRLTKPDLMALLRRTVDFASRAFTPRDLADWPGRTLLVLADDDPATPEAARAAFQALYPGARMHLFHGSGHTASVTQQAEYLAVVEAFLKEP